MRGEPLLSVEARFLEPELPDELDAEYRRTFDRLRGHFRVRGISSEEAADMAQEAAMRAFVHVRRRGMTGDNLVPLMNQIARNLLIDRHRRGGPTLVALDDAEPAVDPSPDPTDVVVSLEARKAVRDAVESLPDRHRDAILLALAGMTPAQVAEKMGIGRNAADALLHRARRSLKDRLVAAGEGVLGLAALAAFRMREGARKAGVRAGIIDPAAAGVFQGGIGAAAAVLVIALNFGPAAPTPASAATASGAGRANPVVLGGTGAHGGAAVQDAAGGTRGTTFDAGAVHATSSGNILRPGGEVKTGVENPASPHRDIFGVDYEVYDDGEHSGPIGPQEDAASAALCGTSPAGCDAVRKGLGG